MESQQPEPHTVLLSATTQLYVLYQSETNMYMYTYSYLQWLETCNYQVLCVYKSKLDVISEVTVMFSGSIYFKLLKSERTTHPIDCE